MFATDPLCYYDIRVDSDFLFKHNLFVYCCDGYELINTRSEMQEYLRVKVILKGLSDRRHNANRVC
jgi:hypothetical protein